jgi:hypothetical protein
MILPLIPFCFFPVSGHIKTSLRTLIIKVTAAFALVCTGVTLIYIFMPGINDDLLFFLVSIFFFTLYCKTTDLPLAHKAFIFLSACLAGAFSLLIATTSDFMMHPSSTFEHFSAEALIIQLAVLICADIALYRPLKKYMSWMIDHYRDRNTWRTAWIVPGAITCMCYFLIPKYYSNMRIGKATEVYIIFVILLVIFTLIIYYLFYSIAYSSVENLRIEREYYIMEMQSKEYRKLLAGMQETSRLRHDFHHQLIVLTELLNNKDYDHMHEYLNSYVDSATPEIVRYVSSPAVNALLSYYADKCAGSNIRTDFSFRLPDGIPVSDTDLCVILGNLLENSLYACAEIEDAVISVKAAQTSSSMLAISVSNPYRGVIEKKEGRFISSRHKGAGQGIESVRITAEKYSGILEILDDRHIFTARVLLQI